MFNENDKNDIFQEQTNDDVVENNNSETSESDGQYRLSREYYENQETSTTNINEEQNSGSDEKKYSQGTSYSGDSYNNVYNYSNTSGYYSGNSENGNNKNDKKQPKKNMTFIKKIGALTLSAVLFGVVAGASFQAVVVLSDKYSGNNEISLEQTGSNTSEDAIAKEVLKAIAENDKSSTAMPVMDVSDVVENVMPSAVSITNLSVNEIQVPSFWGYQGGTYEEEYESSGSGIIVGKNDTELLIVTNNHVVADANTISVGFVDDTLVEAQVKGTDSNMDLAVIAVPLENISASTLEQISIAEIGDSENLRVGQAAIAIGNALGYGQSATTGVISALHREVVVENFASELIQTDAAINPGNSGGALINMQGQVIGINSVKYASEEVEGMGYAIPISDAMPVINELLTRETRNIVDESEAGYIGISGVDVSEEAASLYSMPEGVYIAQAVDGGAAWRAGLKKGDIITKFDGITVKTMAELQDLLKYYSDGTTVDITIQSPQGGEFVENVVPVTLGKKVG